MDLIKSLQDNIPVELKEIISQDEYDGLDEGAQRAYRRVGNDVTQYYRCTSGPKKGKLAADPQSCGKRKDPMKVRHGRRVARTKGAVRVRKTAIRKRTQSSKRVTKLNKVLAKRRAGATAASTKSNVVQGAFGSKNKGSKSTYKPQKLAASFKHFLNNELLNEFGEQNTGLTSKQIKWAESHDWFRSARDEVGSVSVYDSISDKEVKFNNFDALKVWAGY